MIKKFESFGEYQTNMDLDPWGEEDWDDNSIIDDYWDLVDSMGLCPSVIRKEHNKSSFGFKVSPFKKKKSSKCGDCDSTCDLKNIKRRYETQKI